MFTQEQIAALSAKLDAAHVKKRQQAGRNVSYIEGWHAIAEANRIFGFEGWDRQTVELRQLGETRVVDEKCRVSYMARVLITVRAGGCTVVREGCGYGSGIDRDVGAAHESAIKEAETDAMKRALMTFGNPFGLALYDKAQENVERAAPSQNRGAGANDKNAKALEWAMKAGQDVSALQSEPELSEWLQKNTPAIEKLQTIDAASYNALNVKIMNRSQELREKAA